MNRIITGTLAATAFLALAAPALADNAWGNYHWARSENPLALKLGDNVSATWDAYLTIASSDWSASTVLDTTVVSGGTNNTKGRYTPKNCVPTLGRVEVCSAKYGATGWLGIAQIWITGDGHIAQGTAKMNDTYFNKGTYNTPAWRQLVMCQEVAHDFGLDHQDETFDNPNLGTCMDYTNDPDGGPGGASATDPGNEHPNAHDYQQLESIYSHLDSTTTVGQSTNPGANASQINRGQFGSLVRSTNGGRTELYMLDLGNGQRVFTHVIWAD